MFDIGLLNQEKESGVLYGYGMPSDMIKDLNLNIILKEMATKDENLYSICQSVLLNPIRSEKKLKFRQQMVLGAVNAPEFYEGAYRLANRAILEIEKYSNGQKKGRAERSKTQQIYDSLQMLLILIKYLRQMKTYMRDEAAENSDGMRSFVEKLREYYSDEFIDTLDETVSHLKSVMKGGRLILTAGVGGGMKCGHAVVNRLEPIDYRKFGKMRRMLRWILLHFFSPEAVLLNDTALKQEAAQMETNGLHHTLQSYQKMIQEFHEFFEQFRAQIGFYVGCGNLHRKMEHLHMKSCMPQVSTAEGKVDYRNLYELSMALQTLQHPVPNTLTDECTLHIISGANQGGKSTFLRSAGIAQVMMQAGLFVPAEYFQSHLYDNILTHFTRREDCTMNSGRLVEEMKRMSRITKLISSDSLILLNESFASTTEKEGSQIADTIIQALYDSGVTVFMVTHLFAFANKMYHKNLSHARFLSAERKEDSTRTFKVIDHEPTETSFGLDLYDEIIG